MVVLFSHDPSLIFFPGAPGALWGRKSGNSWLPMRVHPGTHRICQRHSGLCAARGRVCCLAPVLTLQAGDVRPVRAAMCAWVLPRSVGGGRPEPFPGVSCGLRGSRSPAFRWCRFAFGFIRTCHATYSAPSVWANLASGGVCSRHSPKGPHSVEELLPPWCALTSLLMGGRRQLPV